MRSLIIAAVFLLFSAGAVSAQKFLKPVPDGQGHGVATRHWCATPYLMTTPEGRAAMERYSEARRNGTLPVASKAQRVFSIGDQATFNIFSDSAWFQAPFEVRLTGRKWRVWMRTDIPDQEVITNSRFEEMRRMLDEVTPEGSLNPNSGIFQNDEDIFGAPPIYPEGSDGIIDLLIYKLDPGVAGFVHPTDYDPKAPDTVGNQSEIMYLDIDNFFFSGSGSMESVIAHEYQHVIHLNYDNREIAFVNEGQSEYAQQLNGFPVAPPFHLLFPVPEYNLEFFLWRGLNSLDYNRASLWTGYLAERIGPEAVGLITRNELAGLFGYEDTFSKAGVAETFGELLADFHTANLINDRSVDPRFGYVDEQRIGELGRMQVPRFDGTEGDRLEADSLIVEAGGTEYAILENVVDLKVSADVKAPDDQLENRRSQMLVRVIGRDLDGKISMIEFNPSEQTHILEGSFDRVYLVFAHIRPESTRLQSLFEAGWTQDPDREVETVGYSTDNGALRVSGGDQFILAFAIDQQGRDAQATRFLPPPGSELDRVRLVTYYFSQFANGGQPSNAARDFELTIWESNGSGEPGDEIYSKVMEDPIPWVPVQFTAYNWFDVDFDPPFSKGLSVLPDTIFIGLQNAGSDDNYLVVWPSSFDGSPARETGFLRVPMDNGQMDWIPLWDFAATEQSRPLNRTALPIEARFVIDNRPVAVEEAPEIPRQVELEQNYPNPFNPSTRVRFALPETDEVSLEVFDVTGRRVATLLEGRQAPGTYTVTIDGTGWTSGVYFYRLTAGEAQVLKRMILLK